MSEQDFRDGLDAALANEPALNFDAEALIERARQAARRRRTLVGAGLASATVAVAAVAVPTILGTPRAVNGAASGPSSGSGCGPMATAVPTSGGWFSSGPLPESSAAASVRPPLSSSASVPLSGSALPPPVGSVSAPPSGSASRPTTTAFRGQPATVSRRYADYLDEDPCPVSTASAAAPSASLPPTLGIPWPATGVTVPNLPRAQVQERADALRAHLVARLPVVVPGATGIAVAPFTDGVKGTISDGLSYLESDATYLRDGVKSLVWVQVSAPGETDPTIPDQECGHGVNPVCTVVDQPDGSALVLKSEDLKNLRDGTPITVPGTRQVTATHYRKDGSQVSVTAYNFDPSSAVTVRPDVSLTDAQLTALATDPRLAF